MGRLWGEFYSLPEFPRRIGSQLLTAALFSGTGFHSSSFPPFLFLFIHLQVLWCADLRRVCLLGWVFSFGLYLFSCNFKGRDWGRFWLSLFLLTLSFYSFQILFIQFKFVLGTRGSVVNTADKPQPLWIYILFCHCLFSKFFTEGLLLILVNFSSSGEYNRLNSCSYGLYIPMRKTRHRIIL